MMTSDEMLIRIKADGSVSVEEYKGGVKSFKAIAPDSFLDCINKSLLRGGVTSGLLPRGCLSFTASDNGIRAVTMLHEPDRADISYMDTQYKDFPLPRLVFGFSISDEGRVSNSRLGVIDYSSMLTPATPMFEYPFSNVSGTQLCIGNNRFPQVKSLHTLGSLPYFILSMDNNNDHFRPSNNKPGLEMRDLMELLKDKQQSYYYEHILLPSGKTLGNFVA
jgi:hypothetical protein